MGKVSAILGRAIDNYFKVSAATGRISLCDRKSLLVLIYLTDFIERYRHFITADDMRHIEEWLSCLGSKTCLIEPVSCVDIGSNGSEDTAEAVSFRITEDGILRIMSGGSSLRQFDV